MLAEEFERPLAALAALAVEDDLLVPVQLTDALRQLAQRDQVRAVQAGDLPLFRVADVQDIRVLAAVEARLQLSHADLPLGV